MKHITVGIYINSSLNIVWKCLSMFLHRFSFPALPPFLLNLFLFYRGEVGKPKQCGLSLIIASVKKAKSIEFMVNK